MSKKKTTSKITPPPPPHTHTQWTQHINKYIDQINKSKKSGLTTEGNIAPYFHQLINAILPKDRFKLITQFRENKSNNSNIFYDGVLLQGISQIGILEDKGIKVNLEKALEEKRVADYDTSNLLLQNGEQIVLVRDNKIIETTDISDTSAFAKTLKQWIEFENNDIQDFKTSFELFKKAVPEVAEGIRDQINKQPNNDTFQTKLNKFHEEMKQIISPTISLDEVKEMIVQHKMTHHLLINLFENSTFKDHNPMAKQLEEISLNLTEDLNYKIEVQLYTYFKKICTTTNKLNSIYYQMEVMRIFYEQFYQAYLPKQSDVWGIVYTPIEIVEFMIVMANDLLKKHFKKTIGDKEVHILDPCVGTGTFIVQLMQYIPEQNLSNKYENEIFANEISILAYYVANLYIEQLHYDRTGEKEYKTFTGICFVDTIDNIFSQENKKKIKKEQTLEGFDNISNKENIQRVKAQNDKPLLLILGNPPYNANQRNENDNNKNKAYKYIDKRIKETYIAKSSAQKTKTYDMYIRFIRWASDRLGDEGMIAFITNRSFLDAESFDGFRASVKEEFSHIYALDLGGDIRKGKQGGNVFNIMTGVAITFFVKEKNPKTEPNISYLNPFTENSTAQDKLSWLNEIANDYTKRTQLSWIMINPDNRHHWINQSPTREEFETMEELINKKSKHLSLTKFQNNGTVIFHQYSLGILTSRDDWVYDWDAGNLEKKVNYFIDVYDQERQRWKQSDKTQAINDFVDRKIKWTSELEDRLQRNTPISTPKIIPSHYRPFTIKSLAYGPILIHRRYQIPRLFPNGERGENRLICFSGSSHSKDFQALMTDYVPNLDLLEKTQCLPLYQYDEDGNRYPNLHTKKLQAIAKSLKMDISAEDFFYYTYAFLQHPNYRTRFKIDLTQNFPRIPTPSLATLFSEYVKLGKELGELHVHFDTAESFSLTEETISKTSHPKCKLKSNPTLGTIEIDENMILKGIPKKAWEYKVGNRSAIDWVLEGYKTKKIATQNGDIANTQSPLYTKYNYETYQFSQYKQQCMDTLKRMITVSLKTQEIIEKLKQTSW